METMIPFTISGLPRIHFGSGRFRELISIIKSFGRNVLLITGRESFLSSERGSAFLESLSQAKLKLYRAAVGGEPSPRSIDDIAGEFRKYPVHVVVSIGGGSVIDAGKAVSAMLAEQGSVRDYLEGVGTRRPGGVKAPFIAVPTTAGTGSEATKNAVLSEVGAQGFKKSLRHDNYMPDVALVDPELTLTCPADITAACGLDAVAQLLESYTSTKGNPFTDSLALSGLQYACRAFPALMASGNPDIRYREMMSYAAMLSGITLSQAGLGTIHGIAGTAGGIIPAPHGVLCGLLLPGVTRRIVEACAESGNAPVLKKIAEVGKELSGGRAGDDRYYCETLVNAFAEWVASAGLTGLGGYGLTEDLIPVIVRNSDNKSSPVIFDETQMAGIMREIM